MSYIESFPDNNTPEKELIKKEFWETVEKVLNYEEFRVIHGIFCEGKNLTTLADEMNYISPSYLIAIKDNAIEKLRNSLIKIIWRY